MAHRSIEILIGRLITDEAFRSAFLSDPPAALTEFADCGYDLTGLEIAALMATPAWLWAHAAEQIDPRLQKISYGKGSGKEKWK